MAGGGRADWGSKGGRGRRVGRVGCGCGVGVLGAGGGGGGRGGGVVGPRPGSLFNLAANWSVRPSSMASPNVCRPGLPSQPAASALVVYSSACRLSHAPGRNGTPGPTSAVHPFQAITRRKGVGRPIATGIAREESRRYAIRAVGIHTAWARRQSPRLGSRMTACPPDLGCGRGRALG